jgi:hypothetical protein
MDAQPEVVALPPNPPPSPADTTAPYWWAFNQLIPKFHQSNTTYVLKLAKESYPLKTNGSKMNEDERKKYELVLTETALLAFRGRRDIEDLLVTLDGGGLPKVGFSEGSPDLDKIILSAVSCVCGITLEGVQMVLNLKVSVF